MAYVKMKDRLMSQTLTDKDLARLVRGKDAVLHIGKSKTVVINADSDVLRWLGKKVASADGVIVPSEKRKIRELLKE